MMEEKGVVPVNLTTEEAVELEQAVESLESQEERRFPELTREGEAQLVKTAEVIATAATLQAAAICRRACAEIYSSLRTSVLHLTSKRRIRNQSAHRPDLTMSGMPFKRGKGKARW